LYEVIIVAGITALRGRKHGGGMVSEINNWDRDVAGRNLLVAKHPDPRARTTQVIASLCGSSEPERQIAEHCADRIRLSKGLDLLTE